MLLYHAKQPKLFRLFRMACRGSLSVYKIKDYTIFKSSLKRFLKRNSNVCVLDSTKQNAAIWLLLNTGDAYGPIMVDRYPAIQTNWIARL